MKLVARRNEIIGRLIQEKPSSSIVRPDETKGVTKYVLVDSVGPDAAAAGIKIGHVVLSRMIHDIWIDGGFGFRPLVMEPNAAAVWEDARPEDMLIQVNSGKQYVPLDHPEAAKPIAGPAQGPSNGHHDHVSGAPA